MRYCAQCGGILPSSGYCFNSCIKKTALKKEAVEILQQIAKSAERCECNVSWINKVNEWFTRWKKVQ